MQTLAASLTDEEKRSVAIYASAIAWGTTPSTDTEEALVRCESSPGLPANALDLPHWSGWGLDQSNSHFQTAAMAQLTPPDLDKLELKWAFGFAGATTSSTQPAVAGGRIFLASHEGGIYALDAKSGCAYWKYPTAGAVRGAIHLVKRDNGRFVLYTGDREAYVYALDADTGEELWKAKVDEHPYAVVTGSLAILDDILYVPVASFEEVPGASPTYECCTFRGSVVALAGSSGKQLWKSYLVPPPQEMKVTSSGTQLWGPSGAGVWSQPTIDTSAGTLYVTTSNNYSMPAVDTSDALVALDLKSGEIRWHVQFTDKDVYTVGCLTFGGDPETKEVCGPDVDFGASALLRTTTDGRRILIVGQKSGVLHAVDPDAEGRILWQKRLSPGGVLGGIEWGFAADEENVYVPISDVWESKYQGRPAGGVFALRFTDGREVWSAPAPEPDCMDLPGCNAGQPAAATLIPGILFAGSMDGHMRAYDAKNGDVLWDYDTKREYDTINGVTARGGAIDGAGVTIAGGWLYFSSGYGMWGIPGNVFLAFGPR